MSLKKRVRKLIKKEQLNEQEELIEEQNFDKRIDEILLEEVDDSDLQFDDDDELNDDDEDDLDIEPMDEIDLDPNDLSMDVGASAEEAEEIEKGEEDKKVEEDPLEKIKLELNDIANDISANKIKLSSGNIDDNRINEITNDLESIAKKTQRVLGDLEEFWNQKTAAGDNLNVRSD